MRQVSYMIKIEQLEGLLDTEDLTDWERPFVRDMVHLTRHKSTEGLTERQLAVIDRIWSKHFA